jgi:NADPH-dependent curcumin reductase CurA
MTTMPENKGLIFRNVPSGLPVKGKDLTVETLPYPGDAPENGVVIQSLYASLDPYMRGRMRGMYPA